MRNEQANKAYSRFERWLTSHPTWSGRYRTALATFDCEALAGMTEAERSDFMRWAGKAEIRILKGYAMGSFLCRRYDADAENAVDAYLRLQGWKENAKTRVVLQALADRRFALWEISDDRWDDEDDEFLMDAVDLVRPGERLTISWGGWDPLRKGELFAAHVKQHGDHWDVPETALLFDDEALPPLKEAVARIMTLTHEDLATVRRQQNLPDHQDLDDHLRDCLLAQQAIAQQVDRLLNLRTAEEAEDREGSQAS